MKPTDAIALLAELGNLEWKPLTRQDYLTFADAGDEARIAFPTAATSARLAELLGMTIMPDSHLVAIIGGEGLQIEIHGITASAEPVDWQMTIPTGISF